MSLYINLKKIILCFIQIIFHGFEKNENIARIETEKGFEQTTAYKENIKKL